MLLSAYPNNRVVMRPSEKFEAKAAEAASTRRQRKGRFTKIAPVGDVGKVAFVIRLIFWPWG